jgi:hypothetical protein
MRPVTTSTGTGLRRWHEIVVARDPAGLADLVREDAVFRSPAVFAPQQGRDLVVGYLSAALVVLGDGFHYERSWRDEGGGAVLEFKTEIDGREVHGVDIIEFDDAGLIRDFTVMVRPLSALNLLVEKMGSELARLAG